MTPERKKPSESELLGAVIDKAQNVFHRIKMLPGRVREIVGSDGVKTLEKTVFGEDGDEWVLETSYREEMVRLTISPDEAGVVVSEGLTAHLVELSRNTLSESYRLFVYVRSQAENEPVNRLDFSIYGHSKDDGNMEWSSLKVLDNMELAQAQNTMSVLVQRLPLINTTL